MVRIKSRADVIKALVLSVEVTNALQDSDVISGEQRQRIGLQNLTPNLKNEMFLDMLETGTQNSLKETCRILKKYNQNHVSEMLTLSIDQTGVNTSILRHSEDEPTDFRTLGQSGRDRPDAIPTALWPAPEKSSYKNIRKFVFGNWPTAKLVMFVKELEDIKYRNLVTGTTASEVLQHLHSRFSSLKEEEQYPRPKVSSLDETLKSYEIVFPLDLSKVTEQQSLDDVIKRQHPKLESLRDLLEFIEKNQQKTMFLLDGLETFQHYQHDIMRLLQSDLLPRATVIASYKGTNVPENMLWHDQIIKCPETNTRCRCGQPVTKKFKLSSSEICVRTST